jgi:hypothetical protein
MSISILTRWRKAFTTDSDGNDALRTVISGDQDLGGGYILDEQTTTNMMSKGTVYWFDESNDTIIAGDAQDITTNDFAIHVKFSKTNITAANAFLVNKEDSGVGYGLEVRTNDLWIRLDDGTTDVSAIIGTDVFTALTEYDVFVTFDRSGNATAYINGVSVGTVAISTAALTLTSAGVFTIGSETGGTTKPFGGEMGHVAVYNFLPSLAEVKDLISGNIPFKWQYGSQTDVFAGFDFDSAVPSTWGTSSATIDDDDSFTSTGAGGITNQSLVIGKEYTVTYTATTSAGTATARATDASGTVEIPADGTPTTFIPTTTQLYLRNSETATTDVTVLTVYALGATLLMTQDSISETAWYDKANGNDGAVTGASVLNPQGEILAFNGNYLMEGASTGRNVFRAIRLVVNDGTNASTIKVRATDHFNGDVIAEVDNIAKGVPTGGFTLHAAGTLLTIEASLLTGNCVGVPMIVIPYNATGTFYSAEGNASANDIAISVYTVSGAQTDITTITDSGRFDVYVQYVTDA